MMNAINFIDGLDGLLSGLTAISGASLAIIAVGHGHPELALVLAALVGGALGFCPSTSESRDDHSGRLGRACSSATCSRPCRSSAPRRRRSRSHCSFRRSRSHCRSSTRSSRSCAARRGKKITEGDREHFHHQLVFRFGLNVRQAVLLIYVLCAALGIVASHAALGGVGRCASRKRGSPSWPVRRRNAGRSAWKSWP